MQREIGENRLGVVDFLRGIAIAEMLAVHYDAYFPHAVARFLDYAETAMPLFVLLAGFMVGWSYRKFGPDPAGQTWVVWRRGLRILAVQYIIVATVAVPLYLLGIPGVRGAQSLPMFVFQSLAFLNQIGLIHILPTFIPLYAVSPLILLALTRGWETPLLFVSLVLFCVGHLHPYLLDLGAPTIFPFILVQLFFVIGALLGKRAKTAGAPPPSRPRWWLAGSCVLLLVSVLLVHCKVVPPHLFSLHPINLVGLAYYAPIMAGTWLFPIVFWRQLERTWVFPYITLVGRHALLAFVVHLYLAKLLSILNYFTSPPSLANYALIAASLVAIVSIVRRYELALSAVAPPGWARAVRILFR